jgi:VIT1/CCC1 family predicted Fe2+/Mn2+ transporter
VSVSLEHSHEPGAVAARIAAPNSRSYLRDAIYGAIDGAVTTFAVAAGSWGAELSPSIVIILGIANLVGDGFSMAAGNFLGTRAENQQRDLVREIELKHIRQCPEGEREEVRQILAGQGFSDDLLERAVEQITSDEETWVNTMLHHEYGLSTTHANPLPAAAVTFGSFLVIGAIPLLPFLIAWFAHIEGDPFLISTALTVLAFFIVGAVKSRFVQQSWWASGLETLAVGAIAAGLAFACGWGLRSIAD